MAPNPFSYLISGGSQVSPERLGQLAKVAAKRFLEAREPLTDTIQKLAEENDLNSNQVERVCEMANLATHQALWPTATEKEKIAFPLADAKKIKSNPSSKPAAHGSSTSDYAGPPQGLPSDGRSLLSMLGLDRKGHDGLHENGTHKEIVIILQKKAAERSDLRSKVLFAGMEAETAEKLAFHAVKQLVLGGTSMQRAFDAAVAGGYEKIARELLPKFEQQLIRDTHGSLRARLEKNAISKAPEELISSNLGSTTVVNGAHPMLVALDTVQKKNDVVQNLLRNILRIDDEVKIQNQKLRELAA